LISAISHVEHDQRVLADGRRITRFARKDGRGWAWRQFPSLPPTRHERVASHGWSEDRNAAERFSQAVMSIHTTELPPADPDRHGLAAEIQKLRDGGNAGLADLLEKALPSSRPAKREGLFSPGRVLLSAAGMRLLNVSFDEIQDCLARHVKADAGLYGQGWLEAPATDDDRYCPPLASVPTQNLLAFADKDGLIRSRYPIFRDIDAPVANGACHFEHQRRRDRNDFAEVITLLVPGSDPKTLVVFSTDRLTV